jgi:hypothetical protein
VRLHTRRNQFRGLDDRAVLERGCMRLGLDGGLEQERAAADLREVADERERLGRRPAHDVVELVGGQDLVEHRELHLRRRDEHDVFRCGPDKRMRRRSAKDETDSSAEGSL